MRVNRLLLTSLALASLSIAFVIDSPVADAAQGQATGTTAKNRVVIQMSDNDPGKWNLALNNARNMQSDLGKDNVEIELVAYGPGISMLKQDSVVGNRIAEAMSAGVDVVACENTMTGQKLTKQDMLPRIGYVQAGVVELMQKQQQGYAYIRP